MIGRKRPHDEIQTLSEKEISDLDNFFKFVESDSLNLNALREKMNLLPRGKFKYEERARTCHGKVDNFEEAVAFALCDAVINENVTTNIVEYFFDVYPRAFDIDPEGDYGRRPLPWACLHKRCNSDVIKLLAAKCPNIRELDWRDECSSQFWGSPLLCYISPYDVYPEVSFRGAPGRRRDELNETELDFSIVDMLVKLDPESLTKDNSCTQSTPISFACQREDVSMDLVLRLMDRDYKCLGIPDELGKLPIHHLLTNFEVDPFPINILQFLIIKNPASLCVPSCPSADYQSTPISLACRRNDVSWELVQALIDKDQICLGIKDIDDHLPIHYIFANTKLSPFPFKAAECLVELTPPSFLQTKSGDYSFFDGVLGRTPLHLACAKSNMTFEIIKALALACPDAAKIKDDEGSLPLHLLCSNENLDKQIFLNAASSLIDAYPKATVTNDGRGWVPFDYLRDELEELIFEKLPETAKMDATIFRAACASCSLGIVEHLYEKNPENIDAADDEGKYPLNFIMHNKNDGENILLFLLNHDSNAATRIDRDGNTPLHIALQERPRLKCLKSLIDAQPQAVRLANHAGQLPLHTAMLFEDHLIQDGLDAIEFLATQFPCAITTEDKNERFPTHCAIKSSNNVVEKLDICCKLIKDCFLLQSPAFGLPIHYACREKSDLSVISCLANTCPESLQKKHRNELPLHCTMGRDNLEFVFSKTCNEKICDDLPLLHAFLMTKNIPEKFCIAYRVICAFIGDTRKKDSNGYLPIHLAFSALENFSRVYSTKEFHDESFINITNITLFKKMIRHYPGGASVQDKNGCLPIHHALLHNAPLDTVKLLLSHNKDSAQVTDHHGSTLLHKCCQNRHANARYDLSRVSYVADLKNDMISSQDKDGCTPLHYACLNGMFLCIVRDLVDRNEGALDVLDNKKENPLHKACRGGNLGAVKYLMERHKLLVIARNNDNELPVHLLCSALNEDAKDTPEFTETIWRLLLAHPETMMI